MYMTSWLQCWSNFVLNSFTSFAAVTFSGNWFQSFIILCEKCCNLIVVLHRGFSNFRLCPRVDEFSHNLKNLSDGISSMPLIILNDWIISPRLLRWVRLDNFSFLNLSVYVRSFSSGTSFVARFCTFSTVSISFLKNGYHIVFPYSIFGLTKALFGSTKESFST